jgi:hypothetical protein
VSIDVEQDGARTGGWELLEEAEPAATVACQGARGRMEGTTSGWRTGRTQRGRGRTPPVLVAIIVAVAVVEQKEVEAARFQGFGLGTARPNLVRVQVRI